MSEQRKYDEEYKKEAVKLANKIGSGKAADELGIPKGTLYGWMVKAKKGYIDLGKGSQTPEGAMSLVEELNALRKKNKELEKANKRLQEENEILAEATAFFAASRRKSGKTNAPITEEGKRGKKKRGKVLCLIDRLKKYKGQVCLFLDNFGFVK